MTISRECRSTTRFDLFTQDEPRIGVIVGTGPSLSGDQLNQVAHLRKFGVNNSLFTTRLDVHLACNVEWFEHYSIDIEQLRKARKMPPTWIACDIEQPERMGCAIRYDLNMIGGKWLPGLSSDPDHIHYHHGAGPQIVNLALHYGCETMLLIGWDMRYPPNEKRHYFGEYPSPLLHFPRTGPNGELAGLIREMETIDPAKYGIEIINCSPGSAMTCFESRSLLESLRDLGVSRD